MIRIVVCGALGRMGRMVAEEIEEAKDMELAGAVVPPGAKGSLLGVAVTESLGEVIEGCDVVIDFTNPAAALEHIRTGAKAGKPLVVGTTGFSEDQLRAAREAGAKVPLLIAPNMSMGVNLMFETVERVARALADFDAEIIEIHHNRKKDSPSGTAARLAEMIERARPGLERMHGRQGLLGERKPNELGIHSLRGGDVVGEHTVVFAGEGERFEITHRAHSRRTFARGAIRAARYLSGKPAGLYSMADVLGLSG
ncbi:MAG TPA: 4-hydroxy-tetrahydrodipicolinate reductase [Candidatus Eisenbacteria bacterium]|uniref:4-hydroxy-tetrahydrodipicolinate reductase n=1 Tax=Eiseniibacteriota bacterium TaxID=2212470 RepID=A0A7V2F2X2_UNCEI|nr:4-hydroxy-tetrahydrodipicolinate reductase [Candidatus Eisenbacteria bacterium]